MKKAMAMPIVLVVALLIITLIGTYLSMTSTYLSKEYFRDLAEVRGYWATYGAKELNVTNIFYDYSSYSIDVNRTGTQYQWAWSIRDNSNSGLSNNDVYTRELWLADDNVSINMYRKP